MRTIHWRAAILALAVIACDDPTDVPFTSGSMSLELRVEGEEGGEPESWSATGSCGRRHFVLGSATCAVGSEETNYWAALAVLVRDDGTFDTVVLVHPKEEGTCEVSAGSRSTCSMELQRGRTGDPSTASETFLMNAGTISVARTTAPDGTQRLTGTFEGTAPEITGAAETRVISAGAFDVELVP